MSAETPVTSSRFQSWLDAVLSVPYQDQDRQWRGQLFNAVLLTGVLTCLGIIVNLQLLAAWYPAFSPAILNTVMLVAILGYGLSYWGNKHGYLEQIAWFYTGLLTFILLLVVLLYDGMASIAVSMFMWLFVAALGVLPLRAGIALSGLLLGGYLLIALMQRMGLYVPPFSLPLEMQGDALGIMTVLGSTGSAMVVAIFFYNLQRRFEYFREIAGQLAEIRQRLEVHVDERTAEVTALARRFQAIAELSQILTSIRDEEALLERTVSLVAERLGYDHVGLFLVDKERQWAVLRAASSEGGKRMLARGHRLHVGVQGIVGNVAFTGVPRIALDVGADAVWFNNPDLPDTRSEMALPLVVREQIIGVLDIQSNRPAAFTQEDVSTLRVLAEGVAIAIDNARLHSDMQRNLERLSLYQQQDVVEAWRDLVRRHRTLYSYDATFGAVIPVDEAPEESDLLSTQLEVREEADRHTLHVPLQVRGQVVGYLRFELKRAWRPEEVRLAEQIGEQLSLAVDNARLLEESRVRALNERARSAIVARLRASSSVEAVLRSLVQEVGRALNLQRVRVQLVPVEERESSAGEAYEAD